MSGAAHPPDTYWFLEGASLLFLSAMGGLFVQGETNVPATGAVLYVANHTSYLDPVAIGDASPRRVCFMAKAELFAHKIVGYLLRGVDSYPVKRGESDRGAFKRTLELLAENRVVCIFPEGARQDGITLGAAEAGAALFATKTGCAVVPVYVSGANRVLDLRGKLRRGKITVAFGKPFALDRKTERGDAGAALIAAIAATRDEYANEPSRRIPPHWIKKPREGSRAAG